MPATSAPNKNVQKLREEVLAISPFMADYFRDVARGDENAEGLGYIGYIAGWNDARRKLTDARN